MTVKLYEYSTTTLGKEMAAYFRKEVLSEREFNIHNIDFRIKSKRYDWLIEGIGTGIFVVTSKGRLIGDILDFLARQYNAYHTINEISIAIGVSFISDATMSELLFGIRTGPEVLFRIRKSGIFVAHPKKLAQWKADKDAAIDKVINDNAEHAAKVNRERQGVRTYFNDNNITNNEADRILIRWKQEKRGVFSIGKKTFIDSEAEEARILKVQEAQRLKEEKTAQLRQENARLRDEELTRKANEDYRQKRIESYNVNADGIEAMKSLINALSPFEQRILMFKYSKASYGEIRVANTNDADRALIQAKSFIESSWSSAVLSKYGNPYDFVRYLGDSQFGYGILAKTKDVTGW